jgi:glycerophosphoryl diester phosphodiesterase
MPIEPFRPKPSVNNSPHIVAHRGISGKAPENTLAAFSLALATPGIDMIELDVRLSKDEEVIVLHDRTLQRTTTGNGRARLYDVAEIQQYDAGSWFDSRFRSERVPTFAEVLTLAQKRCWINVEIKSDFLFREKPGLLERRVLDTISAHDYLSHTMISSFYHPALSTIRRMNSEIPLGVIYNAYRDFGKPPSKLAARVGASVFVCAKHELNRWMLRDARAHGLAFYVYTLNSPRHVNKVMQLGVDGILSDNADEIVPLLKPTLARS